MHRPAAGVEFTERLSLFRDRYLLGHPPGRGVAKFYYAFTLYAADPLKQFYSKNPDVPVRLQRTAVHHSSSTGAQQALLKQLGFSTRVPVGGDARNDYSLPGIDVVWEEGKLHSGEIHVPCSNDADLGELETAMDKLSAEVYRGEDFRDLYGLAWNAVYYAGPGFCLLVFIGVCCPWISLIYRSLEFKTATLAVGVCCVTTGGLMAWDIARKSEAFEMVARMDADPQPRLIMDGLEHEAVVARHHAAFLAFKHPHASLADALLVNADSEDIRIRLWAVAALGKTGDPRALPKLLERLEDDSFFVRYRAAVGLGFLGKREAIEPLIEMIHRGWWYEGNSALVALQRIDPSRF